MERYHSGEWQHVFYDPQMMFVILGPALLGVPIILWLLFRREQLFIVLGAFAMAVPYVLNLFVEVSLANRFLLFLITYFHFAIIWGILRVIDMWSLSPRPPRAGIWLTGVLVGMAALMAFNVQLLSMEYQGRTLKPELLEVTNKARLIPDGFNVLHVYTQLTDPLPEEAIVLTMPDTGWPIPTIKGKLISLYYENPLLLDQTERHSDAVGFFEAPLSEGERAEFIHQYKPGYLLLVGDVKTAELRVWLAKHARLIAAVSEFRMFRLRDTAVDAYVPAVSEEQPVEVEELEVELEAPANPAPVPAVTEPPPPPQPEQPAAEVVTEQPTVEVTPEVPTSPAQEESDSPAFGAPITEPAAPE
jgi:hypothetical protein